MITTILPFICLQTQLLCLKTYISLSMSLLPLCSTATSTLGECWRMREDSNEGEKTVGGSSCPEVELIKEE